MQIEWYCLAVQKNTCECTLEFVGVGVHVWYGMCVVCVRVCVWKHVNVFWVCVCACASVLVCEWYAHVHMYMMHVSTLSVSEDEIQLRE